MEQAGQPPFNVFQIAAFLRDLFQLRAGQLTTVVDRFKRRKVGKQAPLALCRFCNNRACLEMRGGMTAVQHTPRVCSPRRAARGRALSSVCCARPCLCLLVSGP